MKANTDLFENAPVPKAVATMAIPTMISMLVVVIYNARAHPGGGGDHQSLEGGNVLAVLFLLPQHPQGLGEQPELHPAGAHGEVDPRKNQQGDENVGIQKVAGVAQERSKIDHAQIFLSFHFFAFYYSVPRPCLKIVNTPNHRAFCPLDGPIFP